MPGLPVILIGRNQYASWGVVTLTSAGIFIYLKYNLR